MKPSVPNRRATSSIQAAVLMHHQDARQLSTGARRTHQVPAYRSIALRRLNGGRLGLDPLVVFGDLLSPGVVWPETLKDGHRGKTADREFLSALQESAAVDVAVNVAVQQVQ
jgi:hypothetical protein